MGGVSVLHWVAGEGQIVLKQLQGPCTSQGITTETRRPEARSRPTLAMQPPSDIARMASGTISSKVVISREALNRYLVQVAFVCTLLYLSDGLVVCTASPTDWFGLCLGLLDLQPAPGSESTLAASTVQCNDSFALHLQQEVSKK